MSIAAAPPGAPAQPAPSPLTPGTLLLEYRIRRVLGTGGFGITYEAQDPHLDKSVAIKEYLPSELAVRGGNNSVSMRSEETRDAFTWGREEFLKEARVLARFNHPSLIHVYRFFEANNTAYFVMEYAEGQTMDALLMKEGVLPESKVKAMLLPILDGLKDVHRARVLHRDIKPSNIIARKDGSTVLIDFGSARQNVSSKTSLSVVTTGYAPIEQYAVDGHQGPWTDIYALGAVAYRAVCGKRPIESVSRLHSDSLVPATEAAASGKYSHNFLRAIDWALAIHPEDRPVGIADWRLALEGTLQVPQREVRSGPRADLVVAQSSGADDGEATQMVPSGAEPPAPLAPVLAPTPASKLELTLMPDAEPAPAAEKAPAAIPQGQVLLRPPRAAEPEAQPPPGPIPRTREAVLIRPTAPKAPEPPVKPPEVIEERAAPPVVEEADPARPPPPVRPGPAPDRKKLVPGAIALAGVLAVLIALVSWLGGSDEPKPASAAAAVAKRPAKPSAEVAAKPAAPVVDAARTAIAVGSMPALSAFRDCDVCPSMMVVPPGNFLMGSPPGTEASEEPASRVAIDVPFAAGVHEVTNRQWQACVGAGACAAPTAEPGAGDLPVVNVSRQEADAYAQWLSRLTGRKYRLPSEAEWEYAARADTTSAWFWGQAGVQCTFANGADRSAKDALGPGAELASCADRHAGRAPVGSFQANDFGLFDTAGNVFEWQLDCWRENYGLAPVDGACQSYAVRGGSFRSAPGALRSAARLARAGDERSEDLGFRVVAE